MFFNFKYLYIIWRQIKVAVATLLFVPTGKVGHSLRLIRPNKSSFDYNTLYKVGTSCIPMLNQALIAVKAISIQNLARFMFLLWTDLYGISPYIL